MLRQNDFNKFSNPSSGNYNYRMKFYQIYNLLFWKHLIQNNITHFKDSTAGKSMADKLDVLKRYNTN